MKVNSVCSALALWSVLTLATASVEGRQLTQKSTGVSNFRYTVSQQGDDPWSTSLPRQTTVGLPICRRKHDYCGFVVLHTKSSFLTPIQGWCECDTERGYDCTFAKVNPRRQRVFTCQRTETEDGTQASRKIRFRDVVDQYRRYRRVLRRSSGGGALDFF